MSDSWIFTACFLFFKLNWFDAQNACLLQGGSLVSIEDEDENQAILNAIRKLFQNNES
jgi:hypothetical protein